MSDENTDLERRVLAHERILQALIAHMAETEPKFVQRLAAIFTDPSRFEQNEHDYTDTASYAEQFLREVIRLGDDPPVRIPEGEILPPILPPEIAPEPVPEEMPTPVYDPDPADHQLSRT